MAVTQVRKTNTVLSSLAPMINGAAKRGVSTSVHFDSSEVTITSAVASDLATSLTLVNELRRVYEGASGTPFPGHRLDTVVHKIADSTNTIAAPVATDLATAITLANELKADYNAHRSQAGVHSTNDGGNAIAAADATDQTELNTLLNEMRTDVAAHLAAAPTYSAMIRLIDG